MANTTRKVGQQSTATARFYTDATEATLVDPATVTFMFRTSAGVETSYVFGTDAEVTKSAVGVYEFVAPTYAAAGAHYIRVKSTGTVAASELGVGVRGSAFTTP
jgi:hypothetical protein